MTTLTSEDEAVRGTLTRLVAELGYAPSLQAVADALGYGLEAVELSIARLSDAHALLLHPGSLRPWAVHPFALAPSSCWVRTPTHGYWANCLYCGFGIAAAVGCDAVITTRYGGEEETVQYSIAAGAVRPSGDLFHLSTPVRRWWDNVVFACSSFQPFKSDADVSRWCESHDLPRGAVMTIEQLWSFARDWYGGYTRSPWVKRAQSEVESLFARHGLTGPFWSLD